MASRLYRLRAVDVALKNVGTHEIGTSNHGKMVDEFQRYDDIPGEGYPWCMAFIQYCFAKAGKPLPNRTASVGLFEEWARKAGWEVGAPHRGDIVCFNFTSDEWEDHVGIVLENLGNGYIRTVEGNTSGNSSGSQDDGGAVAIKTRSTSRCRFVRVPGAVPAPKRPKPKPKPKPDPYAGMAPMWAWFKWRDAGGHPADRPKQLPRKIPKLWWARYLLHRGVKKR